MAAPTTTTVAEIFESNLSSGALQAAIDTALILARDNLSGQGLDDDTYDRVTLYLAAHFAAVQRPRPASRGLGRANESYQGQTAQSLRMSYYGQTAILLDSTGLLAAMGDGQVKAEVTHVGGDLSDDLTD